MNPSFQIVIVLYNHADCIAPCLEAVRRLDYDNYETLVVDNASTDKGADLVEERFPWVGVVRSRTNRGFAGGNNLGVAESTPSDLILLLNPDTEIAVDCLTCLAAAFESEPRLAVAGCKLLCPDGKTIQHVGGGMTPNGLPYHVGEGEIDEGQYAGLRPCGYAQGAAFAVRRRIWNELDGFDEGFFPAYFEESDFCRRARDAGHEVAVVGEATVIHHQNPALQSEDWTFLRLLFRGRARFLLKHYTARDWVFRFLPAEIKWLFSRRSRRCRRIALRALWEAWTGTQPKMEG